MEKIQKTIQAIGKKAWKKYKVEVVLIIASLFITVFSLIVYFHGQNQTDIEDEIQEVTEVKKVNQKITVDISGAVANPDVYQVSFGARVKDVLKLAGGFSSEADKVYFMRNFNLARIVSDQEKIYVPSTWEINSGIFVENAQQLSNLQPNNVTANLQETKNLININEASQQELDQLPGVGKVTATKIIDNRPYATVDDLLSKKVVNKAVFEKIRDLIEI